jgi:hypothetical protein
MTSSFIRAQGFKQRLDAIPDLLGKALLQLVQLVDGVCQRSLNVAQRFNQVMVQDDLLGSHRARP